jgi:hypothetical protein
MILESSENTLSFIVNTMPTIGFEYSGGSIVLHKLAYELADLQHNVYVFNEPLYPHPGIKVIPTKRYPEDGGWRSFFEWESFSYDPNKTVSINSQISWSNQFNTVNNVRWILHHTTQEQVDLFEKNAEIYSIADFEIPGGINPKKLISIDYNRDKFKNLNKRDRFGFCHIIHKNTPEWGMEFISKFNSRDLSDWKDKGGFEYLNSELNNYEYMLTFDDKTYLTTISALCGTKAIILNENKSLTPYKYRQLNPTQMYGISYGLSDITWANNTIEMVANHLSDLEKNDKETIIEFVKHWEDKLL